MIHTVFVALSILISLMEATPLWAQPESSGAPKTRWTEEQAANWYARQPWIVGSNYIPKNAINQLEMWQPATFDPVEIDRELALAEKMGMNSMRVFLHDLLWQDDPKGFANRIDQFLAIADRHHIRTLLVLFDSCWDPSPHLGPQHPPVPGVHNSGWVQSPGAKALSDPMQIPRLKQYVQGVISRFGKDKRVLGWDLWNEPEASSEETYPKTEIKDKEARVAALLPQVFEWARAVHPTQPLTSGLDDVPADPVPFDEIASIQLSQSDILSFHDYDDPDLFTQAQQRLAQLGRPVMCTEYMARSNGSTFQGTLPVAKKLHTAAFNWGFVAGKTQTYFPWGSWEHPDPAEPKVWFHDIFRPDLTPYAPAEVEFIHDIIHSKSDVSQAVTTLDEMNRSSASNPAPQTPNAGLAPPSRKYTPTESSNQKSADETSAAAPATP